MDPCTLPGDPSMILNVNIGLGEAKLGIMKSISAAISEATGKPESYVAVMINDNSSIIWGGQEGPAGLGCMYSIGSIGKESNGKIQKAVSDLLEPHGIASDKIYINYFDVPRENCGWSGRTFAG